MADACTPVRNKTAVLQERVEDLKGDIVGATGPVLHGLARQLNLAVNQLAHAQHDLAVCEAANPVGGNPPVIVPPVIIPPVGEQPEIPDQCLAIRMTVAVLEETVADLRDQIVGATGSVLHGLAGQLSLAINQLARAQRNLAACEHTSAGWAILLCHWNDNSTEPQNRQFFEDLFTSSGAGTLNMTDYFTDNSHGRIDLAGTEIFGWFDMGFPHSAYVGRETSPGPNQLNRDGMLIRAKAVAHEQGVNLSEFVGVLVCFNVATDLFGGAAGACCDLLSFEPSVLGQEMGHVYGLDHSRRNGSNEDYQDNWDTMSTWSSTFRALHPRWTEVGPGLNGHNMRSQKWLDEKRVWRSSRDFDQVIELRPLHRRDLPGFLGADLPGPNQPLFVELRDKDRWDAGIPEPVVLVHRFEDNHSYIMPNTSGGDSLIKGSVLQYGNVNAQSRAFGGVEVLDIDVPKRTARVRVHHRAATGIIAPPVISDAVRRDSMKNLVNLARDEFVKSSELMSPGPKLG